MRNRIFGAIGILWGGAIVVNWLLSGSAPASQAYQAGQLGGMLFGALMFIVGLYYIFKR